MTIPEYVIDLMQRAKYNYEICNCMRYATVCAIGYTIDISKSSHYQKVNTFINEINRLKKWVENQGGEMIIISVPSRTTYKIMQYATVTIFDPVMKQIEQYINK